MDRKRERAEKQLREKNSELLKKESDFAQKRQVDSETVQKLQKEVNGLRNYMTTAERGWDLLNSDVMGRNPDSKESNESANLYLFFDSTFFVQSPLDIMKNDATSSLVTICSGLPEMIVRI